MKNYVFDANVNPMYVGDKFLYEIYALTGKSSGGKFATPVTVTRVISKPEGGGSPKVVLRDDSTGIEYTKVACWTHPIRNKE